MPEADEDSSVAPPRELKRSISSYQRAKESVMATYDILVNLSSAKKKMIKNGLFFVASVVAIEKYGHLADIAVEM